MSVPDYPFEKNRAAFVFNTLFTKPELITVLSIVREECNRVTKMSLFYYSFSKSLSLEEFESEQSQKHAQVYSHLRTKHTHTNVPLFHHTLSVLLQVQLFLQESWLNTLCTGISSSLQESRDWYNLSVSNWHVYSISKLCRLITLIRSMQQDSLRFLVQESLASLAELLLDACHDVLNCPEDLTWGPDLINSPYRYVNSHYPYMIMVDVALYLIFFL